MTVPKRKLTKEERKILTRLLNHADREEKNGGGPEHNAYYSLRDVLDKWKAKIKGTTDG